MNKTYAAHPPVRPCQGISAQVTETGSLAEGGPGKQWEKRDDGHGAGSLLDLGNGPHGEDQDNNV